MDGPLIAFWKTRGIIGKFIAYCDRELPLDLS